MLQDLTCQQRDQTCVLPLAISDIWTRTPWTPRTRSTIPTKQWRNISKKRKATQILRETTLISRMIKKWPNKRKRNMPGQPKRRKRSTNWCCNTGVGIGQRSQNIFSLPCVDPTSTSKTNGEQWAGKGGWRCWAENMAQLINEHLLLIFLHEWRLARDVHCHSRSHYCLRVELFSIHRQ